MTDRMLTLLEIVRRTTEFFAKAGIENARLDAELILAEVLGLNRMQLYQQFDRPLTEDELAKVRPLVKRRSSREPLQHILGWVEFFGMRLKVDRRALIPRSETEELVDLLSRRKLAPATILDLGTGSGALALGLARAFPQARVVGVERGREALDLARENAVAHGGQVDWLAGDWFEPLAPGRQFDLIAANPPYLTEEEWETAQPEVRDWEPREALVAADEGCADLEAIIARAPAYLTDDGVLALETGIAQHGRLARFAREAGFREVESLPDLSGRDRFLIMKNGTGQSVALSKKAAKE